MDGIRAQETVVKEGEKMEMVMEYRAPMKELKIGVKEWQRWGFGMCFGWK